jgi:hypothetical protein
LTAFPALSAFKGSGCNPFFEKMKAGLEKPFNLLTSHPVRRPVVSGGIEIEDCKIMTTGLEDPFDRTNIICTGFRRNGTEACVLHHPVETLVP